MLKDWCFVTSFFIFKTKLSCYNIKVLWVNLPNEWIPILTQLVFKSCIVSKFSDQM